MATLPPLAQLADHLLEPEGLAPFIAKHRSEGRSWDWIARELWVTTDRRIDTSGVTVAVWYEKATAAA